MGIFGLFLGYFRVFFLKNENGIIYSCNTPITPQAFTPHRGVCFFIRRQKMKLIVDVPFFQAPNGLFDSDLTIYDKIVYLYLCRCGNNSRAFPSYQTIANKCGISRRKAIDTIDALVAKGYLIKHGRLDTSTGNQHSNVYEVIFR